MARVTLLATLLANVDGWTTTSQSVYGAQIGEIQNQMRGRPSIGAIRELGWLWHSPVNRDDTRGLGGGITWAMDAALCDLILPKFREDIFGAGKIVSCKEIHAAVARSFDKWAANNRNFKFTDMTKECTIAGLNFGPPTSGRRHTGTACTPANQPSGCVMPHSGCPLAEIWVTSKIGPFSTPASIAAASESSSVATALPHAQYSTDFRYSNGARPFLNNSGVITYNRQVVETFAGTFSFETGFGVLRALPQAQEVSRLGRQCARARLGPHVRLHDARYPLLPCARRPNLLARDAVHDPRGGRG
jgi:hypothetical protein